MNNNKSFPYAWLLAYGIGCSISVSLLYTDIPSFLKVIVIFFSSSLIFLLLYLSQMKVFRGKHNQIDDVQKAKDRISTAVIGLLHSTSGISSLKTYNDLLRLNLDNREKLEEFLEKEREIIDEYSEKTKSLVSDMSHSFQTERVESDLNGLVGESAEFIRLKRIRFKKIPIRFTPMDKAAYSPVHPSQIKTAIESIIENSYDELLDAETEDSLIAISLIPKDDKVEITIRDNGRGMPGISGEVPRSAIRPGKTGKSNGNGLGLYVALQSIEENGGTVTMRSGNDGLETKISLPLI